MPEQIVKLSPDRDLQCYFLTPSAVAAMSQASSSGYTLSGKWRQQFDWAVVEWNRDNVFEHPALRNLPDGDLSGLVLSDVEERTNCIPFESSLFPVVDWNNLRIWATDSSGIENIYHVYFLPSYPVTIPTGAAYVYPQQAVGAYTPASATMTVIASPGVGNRIGVALLENHHYYVVQSGDTLDDIAKGVATAVTGNSLVIGNPDFSAVSQGPSVVMFWKEGGLYPQFLGANGNRVGVYGFAHGNTQVWQEAAATFGGGSFPTKYQVTLDFGYLKSKFGIPTDNIRKMRWTWAADLQAASFQQQEFQVIVSDWSVTGSNRTYSVAGPGSRRIEETNSSVTYNQPWALSTGNYSGSKISSTSQAGDFCTVAYTETTQHYLYLGTRRTASAADISVSIDGQSPLNVSLALNGEDILIRYPLGIIAAGSHTVKIVHAGPAGATFYFDFLEITYPTPNLPSFNAQPLLALATDWDTYHSQSLPAERTAWLIQKLGFAGRVNHYAGALWFYELVRPGTQYASLMIALTQQLDGNGNPVNSVTVILNIAAAATQADPQPTPTSISHLLLFDDTSNTIVQALAALINTGTNLVWASAVNNQLTITARAMGSEGNGITVNLDPGSQGCTLSGGSALTGGIDGAAYDLDTNYGYNGTLTAAADFWRTDLSATPRINRAARDWHLAYFKALKAYGIDAVAAFSTELMNADPSAQVGIAQCYPDGTPVVVSTPAVQTNFSPTALAFWTQTYLDMASLQSAAGMNPYLQSGEVQWWYFPKPDVGMPFYDTYTQEQFTAEYGVAMQVISSNDTDPAQYPNETAFLPKLIGSYTAAIRTALQAQFPGCRYEILYPTDTNVTTLNQLVNYPQSDWTPANLTCLKTESFTFTSDYRLDLSRQSMSVSAAKGFSNLQRSHLIGISDAWTAWVKEMNLAQSQGMESIVLFALDQFCLIGYAVPPTMISARSQRQG